ncbi:EGF-like domain protein [Dictyocaulus viviparus]|uniref:EGF-like domain protein n=1 Tax=Dictyocaulus viviparus TaxID=29172 RepID=A0A0D8XCL5_DICVI|nr:EGF-like domain protein [Dictyocaulus viviparus]
MNPCKNGALCMVTSGRNYQCKCATGYYGKNCEHKIDACYGHPCLNNAVCKIPPYGLKFLENFHTCKRDRIVFIKKGQLELKKELELEHANNT